MKENGSSAPASAVYFFCVGEGYDIVSARAFRAVEEIFHPRETDITVDGYPVLEHVDERGNRFCFMRQDMLVSYDFRRYLPALKEHFAGFDMAAEVNWHEGANAPDRVLTVHTIGDVEAGVFTPGEPHFVRGLMLALERNRVEAGLDDFSVVTEATHWTGTFKGQDPQDLKEFPVPTLDIEIGSTPESWNNDSAIDVLARSLTSPFSEEAPLKNLLCVGGVHFERSFSDAAIAAEHSFGVSHILPNQWIVSGEYQTDEGYEKLREAAGGIRGGVEAIVFHEGMKAPFRNQCRRLGEELGVPVYKHKKLRKPGEW